VIGVGVCGAEERYISFSSSRSMDASDFLKGISQ